MFKFDTSLEKDNTVDKLSQIALQWYSSENNDASAQALKLSYNAFY
jgi:hypothetical protein